VVADPTDPLFAALADRYKIERQLGQGGMATVYLAQDLKHQRQVAIKVLKAELAAVLGAERFVQEIATTAQLQHPNILALFDSGSAGGFLYYVMPYVAGETLREKLNRETQLGIEEAVKITVEVADALEYAHEKGVIHRDIKPENILLHAGRPIVADFGIALAVSAAAGGRMTETGLSLGTPHYMSPEQATADKTITARSDVYSLASVLYEMLAGEPPHMGNSAQQIIMKIIADTPRPVTELRKSVPPNVAAALAKALEKLPADRFARARDFAEALQGRGVALPTVGAVVQPSAAPRTMTRQPLVIGLAAALVATAGVAVTQWRAAHREAPQAVVRFQIALPSAMRVTNSGAAGATNIAVSPDGKTLAYALIGESGTARVYVRRLDEATAHPLGGTDGAQQPCFSPDGQWIAYLIGTDIWKIQVSGGTPVPVGPAALSPVGLTWSPTGEVLVGTPAGLLALPSSGGTARVVAKPDSASAELYFNQPRALPDGKTVLFAIQPAGGIARTHLAALSLRSGTVTRFNLSLLDPLALVNGTLVYVMPSGALMAVPLDLRDGRTAGNPVALGPAVATTVAGASEAAVSPTGTLIYWPQNADATIGWVDSRGGFQPLLAEPQAYAYPRLSPDGKRIAMTIAANGRSDVWVYDIASHTPTRLTNSGTMNDRPEWSPDGRRVLYRADRGQRTAIWWQPADLSAPATPLEASDQHDFYEGVLSPDGKTLVYQVDDAGSQQADVMYRALDGDTTSRPVAATPSVEAQPRFSPDGKWLAYVTDASGTSQVVVRPVPGPGGQVQVSVTGGAEPVWARDGRRIFYRDGQHLVAASITTVPAFAVTGRTSLFADEYVFAQAPHANYDVSLDGSRFLMVQSTQTPELVVVYGWLSELRARMRGAGGR
jgi:Tol biopolymer transport system component